MLTSFKTYVKSVLSKIFLKYYTIQNFSEERTNRCNKEDPNKYWKEHNNKTEIMNRRIFLNFTLRRV